MEIGTGAEKIHALVANLFEELTKWSRTKPLLFTTTEYQLRVRPTGFEFTDQVSGSTRKLSYDFRTQTLQDSTTESGNPLPLLAQHLERFFKDLELGNARVTQEK